MPACTRPCAAAALILAALAGTPETAVSQQPAGEPLSFESHGSTLQARLFRATTPGPHPAVVLYTGFPGNGSDVLGLGPVLSAAGWTAFFFNPRGLHGSQGEYTPGRGLEDAKAAVEFVRANAGRLGVDGARIAAVGYSHGGWLALMTGESDAPVSCVAAIAPDNLGLGGRRLDNDPAYAEMLRGLPASAAKAGVTIAGDFETLAAELRAHTDDYDPARHAAALAGKPVLLVGGWRDEGPTLEQYIVPLVRALRAAGNTRVTPVTLDDDHGYRATRQELQRTVIDWLRTACVR